MENTEWSKAVFSDEKDPLLMDLLMSMLEQRPLVSQKTLVRKSL